MWQIFKISSLILIGIACIQGLENGTSDQSDAMWKWESFKRFFGKVYDSDKHENSSRIAFEKNAQAVFAHNKAFRNGQVTFSKELNSFADIDPEEFNKRNGFTYENLPRMTKTVGTAALQKYQEIATPDSFDWRNGNLVSPVKNQGSCGSCWAFSATAAMESQILIASGGKNLLLLSEEQLVECDGYNNGCGGGIYTRAWDYIHDNGGINSEAEYPYTSGQGDKGNCKFNPARAVADSLSYVVLNEPDEELIKQTLVQYGPISVAIDATDMQLASQGIYECGRVKINHAVLLVGYGNAQNGEGFWILKNSWGTDWGDQGYFKLSRRTDRDCGMTTYMAFPKVQPRNQLDKGTWERLNEWKISINFDNIKVHTLLGLVIIILLLLVLCRLKNRAGGLGGYLQENCENTPLISKYQKV